MCRNLPKGLLVALCVLLPPLAGPAGAEVVDRIVAVVNDQIITLSEVDQMAKTVQAQHPGAAQQFKDQKALQKEMLEVLIDRKLAQAEAKRRGIAVTDKELEQALKDFKTKSHITSDEDLAKLLARAGITMKELKQQISDQITQDRLIQVEVGGKVTISDAEVRRFYEDHAPKMGGNQVHLRIISLPFPADATQTQKEELQKKAEVIVQELRQKGSFEEVTRKFNVRGDDLGFISKTDLDPKLAEFLNRLNPGDVAPISTPAGFQLMQLVGSKSGQARPLEQAAPEIRNVLTRQQMEKRFLEWIKGLREKAHVKILL
jgi:peptidyl-prolyl cis-trans isomerase SurA